MRASEEITQDEVQAYGKFAAENHIILAGQAGIDNANVVRDYFLTTWKETISADTLEKALPQLRPLLKIKSAAQVEFEQLVAQEPDRATTLANWMASQGKPGQLTNTPGDDTTYTSLTLLLGALRGYEINATTIAHAIDRVQSKPGSKLSYVQAPRRTEPISPAALAAQSEDPDRKPGQLLSTSEMIKLADGSYRSKTPAEQKRERELAEAAKTPAPRSGPVDAWETLSQQLLNNFGTTHSQRANMRQTYEQAVTGGKSWREVYTEMNSLKNVYERSFR